MSTTSRRTSAPYPLEGAALLLFAGVWVIIQNNARIPDNVPGDAGLSLVALPRISRVVEAAALAALFVLHQPRLLRSRFSDFAVVVWLFIAWTLVGLSVTLTALPVQIHGIYAYVAPFLLFGWAVASDPRPDLIRRLGWLFSVYLLVSAAVALFVQLPIIRERSDLIHGLFSDAHVLGAFLAVCSCAAFTRYLAVGGLATLLLAAVCLLFSFFPANEKMIVFNIVWWAGAVMMRLARYPGSRRGLTIAATACVLTIWVVGARADRVGDWLRIDQVIERPIAQLGPLQAWVRAGVVVLDSPAHFLFGIGPGNFGGVAAERAFQDGSDAATALSSRARSVLLDRGRRDAVGWLTNTWANLLAEFGAVGFVLFGVALFRLVWPVLRWQPASVFDVKTRLVALAGLGATVWQGFVTPYTNWAEPIIIYPVIVVTAYCHRMALASVRRADRPDDRPLVT